MAECIVCNDVGVIERHGNYFCALHGKYHIIDPNKLETIILMRFKGKTSEEIVEKLDKLI